MKQSIVTALICLIGMTGMAQSPWTQTKGKAYTQLGFNTISSYKRLYVDGTGAFNLSRTTSDLTLQAYGEYGLLDKTTAVLSLPFKLVSVGEVNAGASLPVTINEGSLNALGNVQIGVRQKFIDKKFLLTGQLNAELPTGSYDDSTGLRTGYDALTLMPTLSIGKGWSKVYAYGYGGYAWASNDYSSHLVYGGELGLRPVKPVWVVLFLNAFITNDDGDRVEAVQNLETGLYLNDQDYVGFGFKFIVEVVPEKMGLTLASAGANGGNFVARKASANFGAYLKF